MVHCVYRLPNDSREVLSFTSPFFVRLPDVGLCRKAELCCRLFYQSPNLINHTAAAQ